jgi:branched-subunit amino acid ABC-type transport system permease component
VSTFVNYGLPGIPYGCVFALMAVGLVLTYRATGVFNLAFGAQAYVSAYAFDRLVVAQHWPKWAAFVVSVGIIAPALGLLFDRLLFRRIPSASVTAKVISALGLLIAIPQTMAIIFGSTQPLAPPALILNPDHVYFRVGSFPVNGLELATTVITVGVVVALGILLRFTTVGLRMRAVVESRRLVQLEGINAGWVAAGAWMLSSLLAGLAGVLLSPLYAQMDPLNFTTLLVAAIAAAAFGALRSIPLALVGGIVLGVCANVLGGYLPPGTTLTNNVRPAFPFVVLVILLLVHPGMRKLEASSDPLANVDPPVPPPTQVTRDRRLDRAMRVGFPIFVGAWLLSSVTWVPSNWVFTFATGLVLSVIFLSITMLTGMGGQLSLCQATFAGVGAFAAGQLASHFGFPVLIGALVGGVMAAGVGVVVALPTLRLAGLAVTIVTLAFALLADTVAFQYSWAGGAAQGVSVPRPQIGSINFSSDKAFLVLVFVVLVLCIGLVKLVRKGTVGRYLSAMRGSEIAAVSMGISPAVSKIRVFALSAGIAGVGGALYGSLQQTVGPVDFNYFFSLVFVVVVVTTGVFTVEGAVQAGMAYAILAQLLSYLPQRLTGIEPILFAFGAMTYASHPEGIVEYQKRRWLARVERLLRSWDTRRSAGPTPLDPGPAQPVVVSDAGA